VRGKRRREMPKYQVKTPLEHDQRRYEPGAEVELPEDQAAPLLVVGVVIPAAPAEPRKKKGE